MLLVATHTKSLPAWQVNRYYGEEKGRVLVREWDVPLWDPDATGEHVPAGVVRLVWGAAGL